MLWTVLVQLKRPLVSTPRGERRDVNRLLRGAGAVSDALADVGTLLNSRDLKTRKVS